MPSFSSQSALRSASWAVPVVRLGGIQIQISFGIVIAAAALGMVAATVSRSEGNADLPRVIVLGTLFWCSGWLVQSISYLSISRMLGPAPTEFCLGVLGVEVGPCRLPAARVILVVLATIASLIVLGSFYQLVEGGFRIPQIIRSDPNLWAAPSIGFAKHDSIWRSAAWLCWAQALLQLYPLPRTLGRQLMGALIAICSINLELPQRLAVFRRSLGAIALLTMGMTIAAILTGTSLFGVHWLVFFVLALMLWISSRGVDLGLMLAGDSQPATQPKAGSEEHRGGAPLRLRNWIGDSYRQWQTHRRLRMAQKREQGEAIDARRVDEILTRLHEAGMDSLSPADRQILERVSESLRRQRLEGTLADPPPD